MEPNDTAHRFEFQLNHHGRDRLADKEGPELRLLKHAMFIINNAALMKVSSEGARENIKYFDRESYI